MNRRRVELKAYQLLAECGITEAPVPVESLAAHIGATIQSEPFERDDLSGMVFKHQGQVIIGINANHSKNRKRFTIAHELGHTMLHPLDHVHVDKQFHVKLRNEASSQAVDRHEIEANAFAAALLMPEAMLKKDLADESGWETDCEDRIEQLAIKYEVSHTAMSFRLANLGLIIPVSV